MHPKIYIFETPNGVTLTAAMAEEARLTVPPPPVIVPVHWKMLSPSGNAETPPSLPIMRLINSLCSLRNCGGEV